MDWRRPHQGVLDPIDVTSHIPLWRHTDFYCDVITFYIVTSASIELRSIVTRISMRVIGTRSHLTPIMSMPKNEWAIPDPSVTTYSARRRKDWPNHHGDSDWNIKGLASMLAHSIVYRQLRIGSILRVHKLKYVDINAQVWLGVSSNDSKQWRNLPRSRHARLHTALRNESSCHNPRQLSINELTSQWCWFTRITKRYLQPVQLFRKWTSQAHSPY